MATASTANPADPGGLLARARRGDEGAYAALVEPHRRELHAHCYRMLGSVQDTEDSLQDALLRAWKAIDRFDGRSSVRTWLYRITTNTCLDEIGRRPRRALPTGYGAPADPQDGVGEPVAEQLWVEPYDASSLGEGRVAPEARYELRESVELAFVAALQLLPPNQRAALIMREVLGFSAKEVATALETSVPAVNSALQRARATLEEKVPERSQQDTLRELGDEELERLVADYMEAMAAGDVERVVAMLTEEAAWSMPPLASWFRGTERVRGFLHVGPLSGRFRWKHLPARVNGQAAVGGYTWHDDEGAFLPFALDVLTLEPDGRIADVTAFIVRTAEEDDREALLHWPDSPADAAKVRTVFERFGLPSRLD